MSKSTYICLRKAHQEKNCSLYPPYKMVLETKKACYPMGMTFDSMKAEVPLQNLLDHTTARLLMLQEDAIQISSQRTSPQYELVTKYGFDGSGSHSLYAMKSDGDDDNVSETNMFTVFLCPIKLVVKGAHNIIWQNPAPSSPMYCRPLRLKFTKETPDLIRAEYGSIKQEIENLSSCGPSQTDPDHGRWQSFPGTY